MDGITNLMDMSLRNLQELLINWEAWHAALHGITESDMTDLIYWLVDGKYLKMLLVFKIINC